MTENQTFWKHNEYRCSFYEEVIHHAKEITSKVEAENPISKASEVAISAWVMFFFLPLILREANFS